MEKNSFVNKIMKVFNDKLLRKLLLTLLSLLLVTFIIHLLLGQPVEGLLFVAAILVQLVFTLKNL